ncbi:MAG: MFS transporter, partial [Vulcanimicrobiaceae bacterium]
MLTTARGVFASRAFRLFYAGQALSYVGDGLRTIAIPLLVYHLTDSASALGTTYALEFLPFAVFGLVGGSLADRLDRRRLMIGCDCDLDRNRTGHGAGDAAARRRDLRDPRAVAGADRE